MNVQGIEIPEGWQVQGAPPTAGPAPRLQTEDLFSVCAPGAVLTLDVSWRSSGDAEEAFVCSLVAEDEWDAPLQRLVTKDAADVLRWIEATVERMKELAGTESVQPPMPRVDEYFDFGGAPTLLNESARGRRAA